MELYGWLFYVFSLIAFFLFGYYFISLKLFEDHEVKNKVPLIIFSIVFSFSLALLEMIIIEILKIGTQDARYLKWVITLCMLTYSTIFLIPSFLLFKFLIKLKMNRRLKIGIAFLSAIAYLWLMLNLLANETRDKHSGHEAGILAMFLPITQVDFLGKIGIFLLAILSGFGAVNCPFCFLNIYDKNITKIKKSAIEDNIMLTLNQMKTIKLQNHELLNRLADNPYLKEKPKFSLFNWIFGKKSNMLETQIMDNDKQIKMLRISHNEIFDDYREYIEEEKKLMLSKTLYGKFLNFLAKILSIYCIYRIFMSTVNIILGRKRGLDPINRLLHIALFILSVKANNEYVDMICSNVSFAIFGYLIFMNVRSFAKNILQFFRYFMKSFLSEIFSSDLIVYILSEILGVYFVSTFLLMQSSFPYQFKDNINRVLEDIDYNKHYDRFDTIFIISSISSMALLWINLRMKQDKYESYIERDKDNFKDK